MTGRSRESRSLTVIIAGLLFLIGCAAPSEPEGGDDESRGEEQQMAQAREDLSMGIRKRYWIAATTDVDPDDPRT